MANKLMTLLPTDEELNVQAKAISALLGAIMYLTRENEGVARTFVLLLADDSRTSAQAETLRTCCSKSFWQILDTRRQLTEAFEELAAHMEDSDGGELPDDDAIAFAYRASEVASRVEAEVIGRAGGASNG